MTLNITYLWTAPSGYLAACIRALQLHREVRASLISWQPASDAPFSRSAMHVDNHHLLGDADRFSYEKIRQLVAATEPDVVVVAGWAHAPYVRLVHDSLFDQVRFVIGADTPIRFDFRQLVARLKIGPLLRKADAICVPGERGFQVMRYWKVPGRKIARLLYGIDYDLFSAATAWRWDPGNQWPKRFAFAGRYAPIKGVDVLVDAYRRYRRAVSDPWPLSVCGTGPLNSLFEGQPGIENLGFMQPEGLGEVFRRAGVFVLPSRLDPWGQVIVEAGAAGLPVICTQTCGASAEMVHDYHNGLLVPPEDPAALASAFEWTHRNHDRLREMGRASQQLAAAFSAHRWAENQLELAKRLTARGPHTI